MPGTRYENRVEVMLLDDSIQMNVKEVQSGRCAPVTEQTRLHMLQFQRLSEQGIVVEINLADGEIIGCPPIRVHLVEQGRREGIGHRPRL